MSAYNKCLQISFILVQLLFMALGGALIGVGVWLELEEQSLEAAIDQQEILIGPYLIIAAGAAVIIVAAIGVLGALCDHKFNRFLLVLYIILVLVVFVLELVGGILAFVYRDDVQEFVQDGLNATIARYNGNATADIAITEAWDTIQDSLDCCGVLSFEDYETQGIAIPASCCPDITTGTCNNPFDTGCVDALTEFLEDNLLVVAAIGIAFLVGEIVVILMAFCLVCCTDFDDK